MRVKSAFLVCGLAMMLAGCGDLGNPWGKAPEFTPTAVPADFAVVVEQATDSYYARQTTRQVVTASDMMSRTTFTYYRDYNNTIARQFTTEHPVNAAQLQAMWNEVRKYDLLRGAATWYYWEGHTDDYRHNERVMEIRANGKSQVFKQLNHFGYKLRDLALDVEAARLPITQGAGMAAVVSANPHTTVTPVATTEPAVVPPAPESAAQQPSTIPVIEIPSESTTMPATQP